MNKFLWGCLALMGLFVVSESLTCNTCFGGIGNVCLLGSITTCSDAQPNCYSGIAVFNISNVLSLRTKGCLASSSCNVTTTGTILGATYTVTQSCCSNTNQCNGAGAIQLQLTVALGAALVAIWSTFA